MKYFSIMELLGWMGWPLLACSLTALAILGERAVFFWRMRVDAVALRRRLGPFLEEGGETLAVPKVGKSPLADMAEVFLLHRGIGHEQRAEVVEAVMMAWFSKARAPVKTLGMLAQIAPLLGLTGTVLGLVEAFRVIEGSDRAVNPAMLAGGIWEALLTTVLGMVICVPLLVAIRIFNSRLETVAREARELFVWMEFRLDGRLKAKPGEQVGKSES